MSESSNLDSERDGPTIDYRGNGAQTAHLGEGDQMINASEGVQNINSSEGQLVNIQKLYHVAVNSQLEGYQVLRVLQEDPEGILSHLEPRPKTPSERSVVSDVVVWLSGKADTEGHRSLLSQRRIHHSLISRRTSGTGNWLMRKKTFLKWRSGSGNVLWLDGIIGSGKSVLASMIVDHLENSCDTEGRSICLYVYFDDEDESKPAMESIFSNILEQLVQQLDPEEDASGPLQKFFQQCKSHRTSQTTEEYLDILKKEAEAFATVYLVVDGLDTHWDPDNPQFQGLFLRAARRLTNWNLLITSRVGTFTEGRLAADYKLVIDADATARDIELYVDMRIQESNGMSRLTVEGVEKDAHFKNHILDTIVKKAQGMFLLAKMHMDTLESQKLLGDFKAMLGNLPESSEKTFEEALQRIRRQQSEFPKGLALYTLSWVAFSLQPVTVKEVSHAYAVLVRKHARSLDTDYLVAEQHFISSCAGIVVVDSQTGLLRAAHEAVMGYVRGSGLLYDDFHQDMARQCLTYLSFDEFSSASEDISHYSQQYPLLEYAAKHWFDHFHRGGRTGDLESRALNFLQNAACISFSTQIRLPSMPKGASGLHACASLGERDLAKKLLKGGISIKSTTREQQTPLHWAVQFGRLEIARLFLEYNAPVDARDSQGNTALHIAVHGKRGGEDMVRLLIEANARMDIRNTQGFTPLRWCLKYGLRDKAIPLIKHKAEVDVEDADGHTPLRLAIWHGQFQLVKLMVLNGCDVNKQGSKDGWSILHHAAQFGYEALTKFLLENKAEVELRDKDGLTPLRWAIRHSNLPIAKLLLDSKADVNATSNDKSTPLIQATIQATTQASPQAAKSGNEQAVWLLLSHEPKMDEQDGHGNTALHHAAYRGHKSLLWLLVEEGASLDIQNVNGRTPLHEVIDNGDLSAAWYMIVKGADVGIPDIQGHGIAHLAARKGLRRVLELLWEHGAGFNNQDTRGLTPLHLAAIERREGIAPYLIQKGAEPNAVDHTQKTALHHAASLGHESMVQELLDCGAQAALQDSEGLTALHHAVQNDKTSDGHHMTILKLGRTGPCLDQQDNNGQTPLMYAAKRGNELAIICLNQCRANKVIRDAQNRTAKDHAEDGKHADVMHHL